MVFDFNIIHNKKSDHVSYRVPRPIHQPMHQSIYQLLLDQPSTDTRLTCRSTVDRESTDVLVELLLMSVEVSTMTILSAYRSATGGILVNYRQNVGRVSSIVERESADLSTDTINHYINLY